MAPILYEWKVVDMGGFYALQGRTRGHPDFEDGTLLNSTALREINFVDGFAVTNSNEYILM